MNKDELFAVGIRAFITNGAGQLLLLQTGSTKQPKWDMPGDMVAKGQGLLDVLAAKIEQEAGIVRVEWKLKGVLDIFPASESDGHPSLTVVYHVELKEGATVMSDEDTDYTWYERVAAGKLLSNRYPLSFTEKLALTS